MGEHGLPPRVVVVHRRTELDELLARHATRQQAAFFLSARGRSLDEVDERHARQQQALAAVAAAVPLTWRRGNVERSDLDRFLFAREDVVVVVGQDGLVANVAKYLDGQPVIGVDGDPGRNPGVLVGVGPGHVGPLLLAAARGRVDLEERTMVAATTDDGQVLRALNEVFVGHPSHQTARYRIEAPSGASERQASSGVVVGTGTGATGWCASIALQRRSDVPVPAPSEGALVWFVREAWPSPATGTAHVEGRLDGGDALALVAETDGLVVFGDGLEHDRLVLSWGQEVRITTARSRLRLVTG